MLEVVVIPFDGAVQGRARLNCWPRRLRVTPGLDPGVHHASTDSCEEDGWPESSPAMTAFYVSTSPALEPLAAESLAPWGRPRYDSELISISRDEVRLNSLAS